MLMRFARWLQACIWPGHNGQGRFILVFYLVTLLSLVVVFALALFLLFAVDWQALNRSAWRMNLSSVALVAILGGVALALLGLHQLLGLFRQETVDRRRTEARIRSLLAMDVEPGSLACTAKAFEEQAVKRIVELIASEQRYRLISAVTSDYTFSTALDVNGAMSLNWVAGAFESMTGYTSEEYRANGGWLAHLHPDDLQKDREALATLQRNQPLIHDIRTFTKTKELQWVRVYAHPVWDAAAGRLVGIVGAVQDITERKRVEAALRHREALERIITGISSQFINLHHDEIDAAITNALGLLGQFTGADRCYLYFFRDGGTRVDNTHDWCAEGVESHRHRLQGLLVADFPFTGEPLKRSEVVHILRVADLPEETPERNELELEGVQSMVLVPIELRKAVVGYMGLDSVHETRAWDADTVALIRVAGEVFANALERKRVERELQQSSSRLELLYNIDRALLTALSPQQIADDALTRVRELIPCHRVSVTLFDFDREEAVFLAASFDETHNVAGRPIISLREYGYYIIDELLQDKPCRVDNVLTDVRATELDLELAQKGFRIWLYLPLRSRGRLIGALNLARDSDVPFTAEEELIALEVANQLAIVLQQQQLLDELQTELAENETLIANLQTLRMSASIVASTLNPLETAERILEQIARVVPYDSAAIQLLDGNVLEIIGGRGFPENTNLIGTRFNVSERELSRPVLRGEAAYILHDDVQAISQGFNDPPYNAIHSWMAVPLNLKGRPIGIISLDGKQIGQFTHRHAELALTFADQVAVALENARLFTGMQKELEERTRAERQLEGLVRELEQRNAELERFTYTVSHDLKSPLVTIASFAGFLIQDARSGNMVRLENDIRRISEAAGHMQRLLDDLLELSRIGRLANPSELMPFSAIVQSALELVHGQLHRRGVEVHVAPDLPLVYGDRIRLVGVLQNLLDNAVKFIGQQPAPRVDIGVQNRNDTTVFFVRDNGIGIDPAYHQKIFGLFDKLDKRSEGTGIGLALVRRIIEVHGGRIWVESAGVGHGATFCFILPLGKPDRQIT